MNDETEILWCESCGESPQTVHLKHAGLCEDCAGASFTEILEPETWAKPCGRPLFSKDGTFSAICVRPYGDEHDHSEILS